MGKGKAVKKGGGGLKQGGHHLRKEAFTNTARTATGARVPHALQSDLEKMPPVLDIAGHTSANKQARVSKEVAN